MHLHVVAAAVVATATAVATTEGGIDDDVDVEC